MLKRRFVLLALVLAFCAEAAQSEVLYRETFPNTPLPGLPEYVRSNGNIRPAGFADRGRNILDQGWDVIRSRQDQIQDVTLVLTEVNGVLTEVGGQNSSAIFGNTDTVLKGDDVGTVGMPASGGINNNPYLPENPIIVDPTTQAESLTYGDGILFASAGFYPFLFFTEEVPANTMSSDVNYVRWRGRNNQPFSGAPPEAQRIHAVLQVDGTWYVSETGLVDPDSSQFKIGQIDISGGNWAVLNVVQLDTSDFDPLYEVAEIDSEFNLAKPVGTVEAWGVYNAYLVGNTRFDYVEFGTHIVQTSIPEPASVIVLALGSATMLAATRWRRRQ